MSSLVGSQLGKYEILDMIGHGGMAAVYKAYQPDIDRHVAIKVLPPHPGQSDQFVTRFKLEARTIARLQHPHILPLYDYGVEGDIFYLCMAYVEGGSLSDLIDEGPMPLHKVETLLRQIASALDYAHRKGVIHRDIKPDNILMDKEGHAMLADFGIVKLIEGDSNLTATGGMVGTPAYMAPEQCQGLEVTAQSDIYSLGVVAYEMVTGKQPFTADTPMLVVLKHVTEPVPRISQTMDGLPPSLEPVMMRALAKLPEDRYKTATDFVQDFTRAVYGDDTVGELARKLGTGSYTAASKEQAAPPIIRREPFSKRLGKSPLGLLGLFLTFVAFLITGLTGVNVSVRGDAAVGSSQQDASIGRLSFSTTNVLGDTVNLRVENLIPPGANQSYSVWLENTETRDSIRLGELTLDALGSGALVYTDSEGRLLPAAFNAARITLENRGGSTGYRLTSPNVQNKRSSGDTLYNAEVSPAVASTLSQILATSESGIEGSSLLESALIEASAASDNRFREGAGSLESIQTTAEYLLNILQGEQVDYNNNDQGENPGRGVGLLFYLDQINTQLDELSEDAPSRLQSDADLIRTCLENTQERTDRILELQRRLLVETQLEAALPLVEESNVLITTLISGADQNNNGRVEPFAGECGLEQVAAFGMLIGSMELKGA